MASLQFDAQEVFRNIDRINGGVNSAMKDGLDIGLREAVDHIKINYSRPNTGKGFTDRTANLRNSLSQDSQLTVNGVEGWVTANMPYAERVETVVEGKYAFLWPGTLDMGDNFLKRIGDAVKLIL